LRRKEVGRYNDQQPWSPIIVASQARPIRVSL
jgi:hypothetical protein